MLDNLTHRWLRIPYTLKVRSIRRPHKPRATLLFLHGLGNTGAAWDDVITKMPPDVRIITIDLLGFGKSPNPSWAIYNAKTQARAVLATLIKLRITTPVVIVGHSMGALVAIEVARRYPLLVSRLILCSPPLYSNEQQRLPRADDLLRQLYKTATQNPETFLQLSAFAMKYGLINKSFNVTADNIESYMAALSAIIINQTSLQDALKLSVPTTIVRGTLDPFVIAKNITTLAKANTHVTAKTIVAGHEVKGLYVRSVVKIILDQIQNT
jgi:pimeloyl-ACP methyl ester carboxylesterase